jgi:hypothetical protein
MATKALAQVQSTDLKLEQIQAANRTASQSSRSNPINGGTILTSITLNSGDNTIPHKLSQKLQGWFIVRQRGAATIYDKQDSNNTSDKTLILNSSASVSVDIFVF